MFSLHMYTDIDQLQPYISNVFIHSYLYNSNAPSSMVSVKRQERGHHLNASLALNTCISEEKDKTRDFPWSQITQIRLGHFRNSTWVTQCFLNSNVTNELQLSLVSMWNLCYKNSQKRWGRGKLQSISSLHQVSLSREL